MFCTKKNEKQNVLNFGAKTYYDNITVIIYSKSTNYK
jgi:hypothetical protein